jgi:hypothetical protein
MSRPIVVRLRIKGGVIVQDCDVYIGRKQTQGGWNLKESEWANKHNVKTLGRDAAITAYKRDLYKKVIDDPGIWLVKLVELAGQRIGCWCVQRTRHDEVIGTPQCHGDVIAHLVETVCRLVNTDGLPSEEAMNNFWKELEAGTK